MHQYVSSMVFERRPAPWNPRPLLSTDIIEAPKVLSVKLFADLRGAALASLEWEGASDDAIANAGDRACSAFFAVPNIRCRTA